MERNTKKLQDTGAELCRGSQNLVHSVAFGSLYDFNIYY